DLDGAGLGAEAGLADSDGVLAWREAAHVIWSNPSTFVVSVHRDHRAFRRGVDGELSGNERRSSNRRGLASFFLLSVVLGSYGDTGRLRRNCFHWSRGYLRGRRS